MEKDHFLDRHPIVNEHDKVLPGDEVFICLKNMQPYAKELQDLTRITVSNYLTSQTYHPRGQKVKGIEKIWDKENKEYIYEERVGRMTYKIFDGRAVLTKDGFKYIFKDGEKLKLKLFDEIKSFYNLYLVFAYEDFIFKVGFDHSVFLKDSEEAGFLISTFNITNAKLFSDKIVYFNNEQEFNSSDFEIYYRNKPLEISKNEFFDIFSNQYAPSNTSHFNFNKYYSLELISYELHSPEEISIGKENFA